MNGKNIYIARPWIWYFYLNENWQQTWLLTWHSCADVMLRSVIPVCILLRWIPIIIRNCNHIICISIWDFVFFLFFSLSKFIMVNHKNCGFFVGQRGDNCFVGFFLTKQSHTAHLPNPKWLVPYINHVISLEECFSKFPTPILNN